MWPSGSCIICLVTESYLRSPATREACRAVFHRFQEEFPELIAELEVALYALGEKDAEGLLPRVTRDEFELVCKEADDCRPVNAEDYGIQGQEQL